MITEKAPTHRAQQKREQILTAARRLFLQHGFADTSTEAIRIEAGVSKETLYRYYASKEELFTAVLRQLTLEHLPRLVEEMLPPRENREAVQHALFMLAQELTSIMMQPEYLALLRVIIAETPRFPDVGTLFRATVPEQSLSYIVALLKQMRDQGVVADIDEEAAARMLLGSLLTYALLDGLLSTSSVPQKPSPERLAAIVELFLRAIAVQ